MIVQNVSVKNYSFGLERNDALKRDMADSKNKILTHVNTEARPTFYRYFRDNVNYLKRTLPKGKLDLISEDMVSGSKKYKITDSEGNEDNFTIEGFDLCYGRLANKVRDLRRCGNLRQIRKLKKPSVIKKY